MTCKFKAIKDGLIIRVKKLKEIRIIYLNFWVLKFLLISLQY